MLLTLSAAAAVYASPAAPSAVSAATAFPSQLTPIAVRDPEVVRRFALPGDPRGIVVGRDGTLYIGLATPQAVIAVNPKTGAILRHVVLDSADIASTKELVSLRTSADGKRLFIANGSDESVSILTLPGLGVVREITMEGEAIRDVLPDPAGRYLYVVGRRVHVFDAGGERELRTLPVVDPMAIATTTKGDRLAVAGTESLGSNTTTAVALYETGSFKEIARAALQSNDRIDGALFGAGDLTFVGIARETLYELPIEAHAARQLALTGTPRTTTAFGDRTATAPICPPSGSGAQIATLLTPRQLIVAEKGCRRGDGSTLPVEPLSLSVSGAYAVAYDPISKTVAATDRDGSLTIYRSPRGK